MKNKYYLAKRHDRQQGVVLAVTLILLVIITFLAVSGMRTAVMEERMAGNSRNDNVAFQLAESALRQAEASLQADPDATSVINAQLATVGLGSCEIALDSEDFTDQIRWDAIACDYVGNAYNSAEPSTPFPPHYFIEFVYAEASPEPGVPFLGDCFYRITARGYGPGTDASVISSVTLQTTYKFSTCSS